MTDHGNALLRSFGRDPMKYLSNACLSVNMRMMMVVSGGGIGGRPVGWLQRGRINGPSLHYCVTVVIDNILEGLVHICMRNILGHRRAHFS